MREFVNMNEKLYNEVSRSKREFIISELHKPIVKTVARRTIKSFDSSFSLSQLYRSLMISFFRSRYNEFFFRIRLRTRISLARLLRDLKCSLRRNPSSRTV